MIIQLLHGEWRWSGMEWESTRVGTLLSVSSNILGAVELKYCDIIIQLLHGKWRWSVDGRRRGGWSGGQMGVVWLVWETRNPPGWAILVWSANRAALRCTLLNTLVHILIMLSTALASTLQFCTLLHCTVLHKMHIMHCTDQLCCIFRCFSGCHNKKLGWFQFNLPKNEQWGQNLPIWPLSLITIGSQCSGLYSVLLAYAIYGIWCMLDCMEHSICYLWHIYWLTQWWSEV